MSNISAVDLLSRLTLRYSPPAYFSVCEGRAIPSTV